MEAINERFIELRKACKKNQSEFSKVLGLSRSGIADIETGRRNVTEKHLIMLDNWDEYNVNIEWLRTGQGEMFLPTETDVLRTVQKEYGLSDAQLGFVSTYVRLPENEKNIILKFLQAVSASTETFEEKVRRESALCPGTLEDFEKTFPAVDPDKTKTG